MKIAPLVTMLLLILLAGAAQSTENATPKLHESQARAVPYSVQPKDDLEEMARNFRRWVREAEEAKKDTDIARLALELGRVYTVLADFRGALECFEKSLRSSRKMGMTAWEGASLAFMARIHYELGAYEKAVECAQNSVPLLDKSPVQGLSFIMLGRIHRTRGKYQKSLEYFEKSLGVRKRYDDLKGEAFTLNNMAMVYQATGQYRKALEQYGKALEVSRQIGDPEVEGISVLNLARIHLAWGQYEKALDYYNRALAVTRKVGDKKTESATMCSVGRLQAQMGNYEAALSSFRAALEILEKIGTPTDNPINLIGNLYLDIGESDSAEPYIVKAGYASSLGRLYLARGNYSGSKKHYERLLESARKSENVDDLFTAYTGLGAACEALGDYVEAEKNYESGVRITEEIRSRLLPSERRNFLSVKINGFYRAYPAKGLARVRMRLRKNAQAIDSMELTRARAFADNLSTRIDFGSYHVPHEILTKEEELVSRVASLKKALAQLSRDEQGEGRSNLAIEVKEAEGELDAFIKMLWAQHRRYASVKYPRPVSLRESELRPDEHVVIFDVSASGVVGILLKGKEIVQTTNTKWPLEDLQREVDRFREFVERVKLRDFDPELAKTLYDKLLAPLLGHVPRGTPLIIMPDGILATLPFEALVVSGKMTWQKSRRGWCATGLTYFGDLHPVKYHNSITALTLARTVGKQMRRGHRLLVLADPVFHLDDDRAQLISEKEVTTKDKEFFIDLMNTIEGTSGRAFRFRRLADTGELAKNLRTLYGADTDMLTGLKANKYDFLTSFGPLLDRYRWIVVATHGLFSNRIPGVSEPFLALTMVPPGTDGFLTRTDVMGLRMNADIVALTACQTGLGKDQPGEGVMSMGRAFQYAGARSVLMTLWSVEVKSSVALVESFFKHVWEGKTKLEALRLARKELRKSGYDHPFFWAPFILVGEADGDIELR